MVFAAVLVTNKKFPAGSSTTDEGSEPVAKGEPLMGLRLPVPGLVTKPRTVLVPPAFVHLLPRYDHETWDCFL